MITKQYFKNDPIWVQKIQQNLFWDYCQLPYNIARDMYIKAENVIGHITQLGLELRSDPEIHYYVIEYLYDRIAMKFRYENLNKFENHLPGILEDMTEEGFVTKLWVDYYRRTIIQIFEFHNEFPRKILLSYINENEKEGISNMDYIKFIVDDLRESQLNYDKEIIYDEKIWYL